MTASMTRAQSRQLFERIIRDFLDADESSPIAKSLKRAGINSFYDLINIKTDDILNYTPSDGEKGGDENDVNPTPLPTGYRRRIELFIQWAQLLVQKNNNIHLNYAQWETLVPDEFDEFRLSVLVVNAPITSDMPTTTPARSPSTSSEIDIFKKTMKKDPTVFPVLKEQKHWNNWNRSTIAHARAQDISEVFDADFVPSSETEKALFAQKQSYAYSILNRCVQTDVGKSFVREHEADFDAQAVYKKLLTHAKKSTAAKITMDELTAFLTTTKLDSRWTGTTEGFILNWREQLRLLEDMLTPDKRYDDSIKRRMLENAVSEIMELNQVKIFDDLVTARGEPSMDYDSYCTTLMAAAVQRDAKFKMPHRRSKNVINVHDSSTRYHSEEDYYDTGYVDAGHNYVAEPDPTEQLPISVLQHRGTPSNKDHRQPVPFLPMDMWKLIPKEVQDYIRANGRPKTPGIASKGANSSFSVNSHELASPDDLAGIGDGNGELGPDLDVQDFYDSLTEEDETNPNKDGGTALLAHITNQAPLPPGDIRRVLAASSRRPTNNSASNSTNRNKVDNTVSSEYITVNGKRYRHVGVHNVKYNVSHGNVVNKIGSLIDRGANGGMAGDDVRLIESSTSRYADITGINDITLNRLPISTVAGVVLSHHGPIVLIMHQYAYHGKGKTIHSSIQIENFGNKVDDRSNKVQGGKQCLTTLDGYVIPFNIRGGLAYLDMHPPTNEEYDNLPHVVLTSDVDWDPTTLDSEIDYDEWFDTFEDLPGPNSYGDDRFDAQGFYRNRQEVNFFDTDHNDKNEQGTYFFENAIEDIELLYSVNSHNISMRNPNFEALRPLFGWVPAETVKRTFDVTTRWARSIERYPFRKHFKSRFPALNVHRRQEAVATDTVYADTPAIDSGATSAQIFCGLDSLVTDVFGMKSDKEFVNTLEDIIRKRGAMDKLVSDRAQVEISYRVQDILRNYVIADYQSEPYHEHQNPAERRYQTVKTFANTVLDRTGAPAYTWLLALMYACYVLNHLAVEGLGWQTPLQKLTGVTPDISAILNFQFWEPVYYGTDKLLGYDSKPGFPSETSEGKGRFVGFAESVGDALTYKVLTDDTKKVIYRSYVRSALDPALLNRRLDPDKGESPSKPIAEIIKMPKRTLQGELSGTSTFIIHPDDLINRTYLTEPDDKGQRFRAKIIRKIVEREHQSIEERPECVKFLVSLEGDKADEIVAYGDILDHLEEQFDGEKYWTFQEIIAHEGPLKPGDPTYKGSSYNVLVVWEDGSRTFEPLDIIGSDQPVICAQYAEKCGLLDTPGWMRFRKLAKREKKMLRTIKQAKLASFRRAPIYQFGYRVPRSAKEAILIDEENGNTRWQDAMGLELTQLNDYNTFKDLGKNAVAPKGYQLIRVHFVFAVKHDGRHKARLVAGGHLTEVPVDSVYSGVVSLRSLRIVIFLAELNGLETYGADVGNAYLEAYTREKVYIIAGEGFGDKQGHVMIIHKALYGLRSSGLRWHERLADTLRDMGFAPSKADPDVWMREKDGIYEYIAVYVDDLAIAAKNPKMIADLLVSKYHFKLRDVEPIKHHLGCDYERDPDGTLYFGPKKYIGKMMGTYEKLFGSKPRTATSPLIKNDHPELDETDFLNPEEITKYQSMIGALQWVVSLGRFDILTAVMTMSRFRALPRQGHLERLKRIYGYLYKFDYGAIRVRTGEPDYSDIPDEEYGWMYTVYGTVQEIIPDDAPTPLGCDVVLTTYVDANLYHDFITGRSVTGILHLLNGTPIDWFSKRQGTVEVATYGSEFVAARIATDQIIDLRTTLRYLGVPVKGKSYMFGDNKSVITSSTLPHSVLNKRHNALSYHRVREAIAAKIVRFVHISGSHNPADILSKHCGFPQLWPLAKPLLFWRGDTSEINDVVKVKDATFDPGEEAEGEIQPARDGGECQEMNKVEVCMMHGQTLDLANRKLVSRASGFGPARYVQ